VVSDKQSSNDPQLLKEVIGIFFADCPEKLAELRTAVRARNSSQIASGSHALRGSVSTFGAKTAIEAAQKLESMGRQGQVKGVNEAFLCSNVRWPWITVPKIAINRSRSPRNR
jgi:HPt (histidine-containing phosphotransfer) domain-containing protein